MEIRKGLEIRYFKGDYGYYSTYFLNKKQIPESMVSAILHKEMADAAKEEDYKLNNKHNGK